MYQKFKHVILYQIFFRDGKNKRNNKKNCVYIFDCLFHENRCQIFKLMRNKIKINVKRFLPLCVLQSRNHPNSRPRTPLCKAGSWDRTGCNPGRVLARSGSEFPVERWKFLPGRSRPADRVTQWPRLLLPLIPSCTTAGVVHISHWGRQDAKYAALVTPQLCL